MKPTILIVGVFHMRYSPDIRWQETEGLLKAEQQAEIKKVLEQVKVFSPNKVAVEVVKEKQEPLTEEYQSFRKGGPELDIDEVHQLAFRLADNLGLTNIHAIDWMESMGNRSVGEVLDWAKEHTPEQYQEIEQEHLSVLFNHEKEKNLYQKIKACNEEHEVKRAHEIHLNLSRIGEATEYIGVDWVRWWYQRNLTIFSNLVEITKNPTDRTLLFIGHSHVYLLNQLLKDSGLFHVEHSHEYF